MLRSLKKIATENKKISSIFDTESKEMKFWKVHYEDISSGNASGKKNTQTRLDTVLLKWTIALLVIASYSVYKEIAQVIDLPGLSYVLRKTKKMVRAQYVRKDSSVKLATIQMMSKKLIDSDNEEIIYGSLGFDDMCIKAGIGWDIDQSKIVKVDT